MARFEEDVSPGTIFRLFSLPETNSSPMKIPMFPGKYHQNGGFSMAMLVAGCLALSFLELSNYLFPSLKLTASLHLEMDGTGRRLYDCFLLAWPIFRFDIH